MIRTNWDLDLEFAAKANILWQSWLEKLFNTKNIVSKELDLDYQKSLGLYSKNNPQKKDNGGDFIVHDQITIEVKTRREYIYNRYRNDVALEIISNDMHKENQKKSAFLECTADLWGYAFLTQNETKLTDPRLYVTSEMQKWFTTNQYLYNIQKTLRNETYGALFRSVPVRDLERFRYSHFHIG